MATGRGVVSSSCQVGFGFPGRETFRNVTIQRGRKKLGGNEFLESHGFFLNEFLESHVFFSKMRERFLPCLFFHREFDPGEV